MKILKYADFIKEAEQAPEDMNYFRPATYYFESPVYVTIDVDGWIERNKQKGSTQMFLDGILPYFSASPEQMMKMESLLNDPEEFYSYAEKNLPGNYEMKMADSDIDPMDVKFQLINAFNDKGDPSQFATIMGLGPVRAIDVTDDGNFKLSVQTASGADEQKLGEIEDFLTKYLEQIINPFLESKPVSLGIGKPAVYLSVYSDEPEWFMKVSQ